MKKNLKKYVKRILICSLSIFLIFFICDLIVFFFSIDRFILKYDVYIPLGSFDAYGGGGERILESEEVDIATLYYTMDVDYLIKKYNFLETESNDSELIYVIEKIESNVSSENKEKIEEYLQIIPKNCYYLFIENENGKLLLFMDRGFHAIYYIENKVLE